MPNNSPFIIPGGANLVPTYDVGTWIPNIAFAGGNGDLVKAFSTQTGNFIRIGTMCLCAFQLNTSTWTWTTAAGALRITGLPFIRNSPSGYPGLLVFQGLTKAGYTEFVTSTSNGNSFFTIGASGSGVVTTSVQAADLPSGTPQILLGTVLLPLE